MYFLSTVTQPSSWSSSRAAATRQTIFSVLKVKRVPFSLTAQMRYSWLMVRSLMALPPQAYSVAALSTYYLPLTIYRIRQSAALVNPPGEISVPRPRLDFSPVRPYNGNRFFTKEGRGMQPIYFDHAATTQVLPEAAQAALTAMREEYGNPSSQYALGKRPPRPWPPTGRRWPRPWGAGRGRSISPPGAPRGTTGPSPWPPTWGGTGASTSSPPPWSTRRCWSPARPWRARGTR